MSGKHPMHMMSLVEVAQQIKSGEITSTELTQYILARISACDGYYKAYAQVIEQAAIKSAELADEEISAGNYRGFLHGIPIAVKDLFHMEGTLTEAGSKLFQDQSSQKNSAVVESLLRAGAVILGKLNMTEFALSGYHPEKDVPINPWNEKFWSGVSSSGSAVAAAAGIAYATIGTDTGGSIRFPACSNGVVGIKPTFGSVSCYGCIPLAQTLDTIGPLARRIEDAAIVLQTISGLDNRDPLSTDNGGVNYTATLKNGVRGLRIGIDEAYIAAEGVHPEVSESVRNVLRVFESKGAEIINVDMAELGSMSEVWGGIVAFEAVENHKKTYPICAEEYGPVFKDLLDAGATITNEAYEEMQKVVKQAREILATALNGIDMVICPASPLPTGTTDELSAQAILPAELVSFFMMYAAPFNYTGSPTVTMPCGYDSESNMPLGVQLVGHHHEEGKLIQAAYAYEQHTDWHKKHPTEKID